LVIATVAYPFFPSIQDMFGSPGAGGNNGGGGGIIFL